MAKQIVTVRLDEDLVDDLENEAEERGFSNRTEYIRNILRNRERTQSITTENTADYDERLNAVEERVAALEAQITENTPREDDVTVQNTRDAAQSEGEPDRMEHLRGTAPRDRNTAGGTGDPAPDDARAHLRDELPGSGDHLAARVDAILAMRDELRDRGEAEKGDLLEAVDVEATGYSDGYSLWKNAVAGRDTLRALPGVEPPPTGRSTWRWRGEDDDPLGGDVYDPTDEF